MQRPPLLWPSVLTPPTEIEAVKSLNAHVSALPASVDAWDASLQLYRLSKSAPPGVSKDVAGRWRWLACDECIHELYHLRARLEKIQSVLLKACPSLLASVNSTALRSSRKKLEDAFPGIAKLRHATAHKGENEAHPELHAPDGRFALAGFRQPDRYSAPYKGKLYALDITIESLRTIESVVGEYLDGFRPAAAALEAQGHLD
jgi:hypothetical protein